MLTVKESIKRCENYQLLLSSHPVQVTHEALAKKMEVRIETIHRWAMGSLRPNKRVRRKLNEIAEQLGKGTI